MDVECGKISTVKIKRFLKEKLQKAGRIVVSNITLEGNPKYASTVLTYFKNSTTFVMNNTIDFFEVVTELSVSRQPQAHLMFNNYWLFYFREFLSLLFQETVSPMFTTTF